jgi:hypothetical protein
MARLTSDHTHQASILVQNRHQQQVVTGEDTSHLLLWCIGLYRDHVGAHDLSQSALEVGGQQTPEIGQTDEMTPVVGDIKVEQPPSLGDLSNRLQCVCHRLVGVKKDDVGIHQTTGGGAPVGHQIHESSGQGFVQRRQQLLASLFLESLQ